MKSINEQEKRISLSNKNLLKAFVIFPLVLALLWALCTTKASGQKKYTQKQLIENISKSINSSSTYVTPNDSVELDTSFHHLGKEYDYILTFFNWWLQVIQLYDMRNSNQKANDPYAKNFMIAMMDFYSNIKTHNAFSEKIKKSFENLSLTDEELQQVFDKFALLYINQYKHQNTEDLKLLEDFFIKYIDTEHTLLKKNFLNKKKREKEERAYQSQKKKDKNKMDELMKKYLDYLLMDNMHKNRYISPYEVSSCENMDYHLLDRFLGYKEADILHTMQEMKKYLSFSKDREGFLSQFTGREKSIMIQKMESTSAFPKFQENLKQLLCYYKLARIYQTKDDKTLSEHPIIEESIINNIIIESLEYFHTKEPANLRFIRNNFY